MSKKNTELKVGDWVGIRMTGINSGNEPAYQIEKIEDDLYYVCLLYTSPSKRDQRGSRMPSSA